MTFLECYTTLELLGAINDEAKLLSQLNVTLVLTVRMHLTILNPNTGVDAVAIMLGICV
jgi:hypothetical protein